MDDSARKDVANAQRELKEVERILRSMRRESSLEKAGLFTLVVACGGASYTTQVSAASAQAAVTTFLDNVYPATALEAFGAEAPQLNARDLIYVTPMDGLVNVWAVSAGRDGKYISAVCALTESSDAA